LELSLKELENYNNQNSEEFRLFQNKKVETRNSLEEKLNSRNIIYGASNVFGLFLIFIADMMQKNRKKYK